MFGVSLDAFGDPFLRATKGSYFNGCLLLDVRGSGVLSEEKGVSLPDRVQRWAWPWGPGARSLWRTKNMEVAWRGHLDDHDPLKIDPLQGVCSGCPPPTRDGFRVDLDSIFIHWNICIQYMWEQHVPALEHLVLQKVY